MFLCETLDSSGSLTNLFVPFHWGGWFFWWLSSTWWKPTILLNQKHLHWALGNKNQIKSQALYCSRCIFRMPPFIIEMILWSILVITVSQWVFSDGMHEALVSCRVGRFPTFLLNIREASWAAAFPAITVSISFCWFCVFYAASFSDHNGNFHVSPRWVVQI